jgi:hypothetical protein
MSDGPGLFFFFNKNPSWPIEPEFPSLLTIPLSNFLPLTPILFLGYAF